MMVVMPADHVIRDGEAFVEAVAKGCPRAGEGSLVTFGVVPDEAETGYGYIKAADDVAIGEVSNIDKFVEKPDLETASRYLDEGGYYWNSGMFMVKASTYLEALQQFAPDIYRQCMKAMDESMKRLLLRPKFF